MSAAMRRSVPRRAAIAFATMPRPSLPRIVWLRNLRRVPPSVTATGGCPTRRSTAISQSGLWAITVPREYGGAGVSAATLAEVTAIISAADGSIGQIPQNHFFVVEAIRLTATEEQKRFWFGRVLAGERFGNALSEAGTQDSA